MKQPLETRDKDDKEPHYAVLQSLALQGYRQIIFTEEIVSSIIERALEVGFHITGMKRSDMTPFKQVDFFCEASSETFKVNLLGEIRGSHKTATLRFAEKIVSPELKEYFNS